MINSPFHATARRALASFAACILLAVPAASRASVVTSGNFKTGTPTPTLSITTPINFTITSASNVTMQGLVFDEWVTNDNSISGATVIAGLLNYQINDGATQTVQAADLIDNYASGFNGLTVNDGYLQFPGIVLAPGQTFTLLPSTFTFNSGGANFNTPPALFNGNAFLLDNNASRVSNLTSVNTAAPEPSTWACVLSGAALLGLRLRRLRAA